MTTPTKKSRKPAPLVTAAEMAHIRLQQLCNVFSMADTTLAGHRVECRVDNDPNTLLPPAMSSHGVIVFNSLRVPDVNTVEGLVNINGLNYHELAHILYTPQQGNLLRRVQNAGNHQAFNVLEDQRIETILVAKYPSVAPYLVATCAEYFVKTDKDTHDKVWPYVYGRRYLPAKMRRYFETEAKTPTMRVTMQLVERIVDEYVALDVHDPRNENRAFELIEKFATVIGKQQQFSPFGHGGAGSCATGGGQGVPSGTQAANAKADQDAANDAAADGSAPGAGDDGEDGEGQGQGSGSGADDGDDGEGSGADGDDDGDEAQGSSKGNGAGSGAGNGNGGVTKSNIDDVLRQVAGEATATPDVQDSVRRQREAMSLGKKFKGTLPIAHCDERDVASGSKLHAKQFGRQLSRLVADSDPGWHTHRASGRVNVRRAMQGAPLDEVFDDWDSGKQDTDSLELVVLVDTSDSMEEMIDQAFEAVWTIKYGAESLGGNVNVSVIRFAGDCSYIYAPGVRAKNTKVKNVVSSGGTYPNEGIKEALRILHNSTKRHKMALFVTDGDWMDAPTWQRGSAGKFTVSNDEAIERMNANGITTACVFLMEPYAQQLAKDSRYKDTYGNPAWYREKYGHGCTVFQHVQQPGDLAAFGKAVVTATLKK